jgi:hypothetical protein
LQIELGRTLPSRHISKGEHRMGTVNPDDPEATPTDRAGKSKLRGRSLTGADQTTSVEHTEYEETRNTDTTLRLDDEEDTLYDDGLELEDDSAPFTGKDGRDDT